MEKTWVGIQDRVVSGLSLWFIYDENGLRVDTNASSNTREGTVVEWYTYPIETFRYTLREFNFEDREQASQFFNHSEVLLSGRLTKIL